MYFVDDVILQRPGWLWADAAGLSVTLTASAYPTKESRRPATIRVGAANGVAPTSTFHPATGHLPDTSTIGVLCQIFGQELKGTVGTTAWWELDSHGLYVSDAWLVWSPARPPMPAE